MKSTYTESDSEIVEKNTSINETSSSHQMKIIQQRGRASNVFVSSLIDKEFNDPKGKTCQIKIFVDSPYQREGLKQTLKCEYLVNKDKLKIEIQTIDEYKFNVPPNTLAQYLKMALNSNPLVSKVEDNKFSDKSKHKAFLYISPVTLQYSATTGDDTKGKFTEPKGTYIASNEFKEILKDEISVESMTNQF